MSSDSRSTDVGRNNCTSSMTDSQATGNRTVIRGSGLRPNHGGVNGGIFNRGLRIGLEWRDLNGCVG